MSKMIQFTNEEETCECPYCELLESYVDEVSEYDAISIEDLREILDELIFDVRKVAHEEGFITGYDIGHKEGYKSAIRADIEVKQEILAEIDNECECCEDCCDC